MLVGIDVVNVDRFEKLVGEDTFFKKYFNEYEREYVMSKAHPAESLAGLYASKEAFLKALGIGIGGGIDIKDISIKHDKLGKPYYDIESADLRDKIDKYSIKNIDLSISHTGSVSTAICVILQIA